jgi:cardiolipin synthase
MPAQPSSPAETLAKFVAGSPPSAVSAIANGLRVGAISLTSSSVGVDALPHVSSETAQRAVMAFRLLAGGTSESAVALALDAANALRTVERLDRPEIEIVWTGPAAEGPLVRSTADVITEMLREVRDTGEILVVGYSLTADPGTAARDIIDLLGDASRKHVAITVILHQDEAARNRDNLLHAWNVFAKKPKVWTWDPPPEYPYTKLHAKVVVVDRLDALVTSANLTRHGLAANIELGLRVKGPPAAAIAERFDHLMAAGVLHSWTR